MFFWLKVADFTHKQTENQVMAHSAQNKPVGGHWGQKPGFSL